MPQRYTPHTSIVHRWHEDWCKRAVQVDVRGAVAGLAALVRSRRPAILHGATGFKGGYVDLIAAGVLARRGYPVLVAEATWEIGSRALDLDRLARIPAPIGYDAAPQRGRALSLDAVRLDTACVHSRSCRRMS